MIKIEGISKQFKFYHSPADRLKEILFRRPYHKDFVALENISFEVKNGETLGIIGQNGAGKSTILKILSGIVIPDKGTIKIDGKVTGLLELGTGFNYEMTGLENISMNGTLIGMTREEIDQKKQMIINFSELGDFINEPIKTYSSGMVMRLAFSIAIHADPTCFLVDEALSVGDAYFQQKCMRKIREFRASGGSIIFVSHDMNAVKTLCDSAIMMDHGKMISSGIARDVVDCYQNTILQKMHQGDVPVEINIDKKNPILLENNKSGYGISTNQVQLLSIKIIDNRGQETSSIKSGETVEIVSRILSRANLSDPHYGIIIRDKYGSEVYGVSTETLNLETLSHNEGKTVTMKCTVTLPLAPGDYSLCIGVGNGKFLPGIFREYCLLLLDVVMIKILQNSDNKRFGGIVDLNARIETFRE
jgi:lipopolysaccharide transport system ATP-binding protein